MSIYKQTVQAISPRTGLLTTYELGFIEAESLVEAIRVCEEEGLPFITVSPFEDNSKGVIYKREEDLNAAYQNISSPSKLVEGMTFDDFMDWLELARNREDVLSAIKAFEREEGMENYIKVMRQYLKDNFND